MRRRIVGYQWVAMVRGYRGHVIEVLRPLGMLSSNPHHARNRSAEVRGAGAVGVGRLLLTGESELSRKYAQRSEGGLGV